MLHSGNLDFSFSGLTMKENLSFDLDRLIKKLQENEALSVSEMAQTDQIF